MGIIPRSVSYIFGKLNSDESFVEYKIHVSFLEITEILKDMMDECNDEQSNDWDQSGSPRLTIRMTTKKETFVEGLSGIAVKNIGEVLELISVAKKRRTTVATKMNETSSRGHLIMKM